MALAGLVVTRVVLVSFEELFMWNILAGILLSISNYKYLHYGLINMSLTDNYSYLSSIWNQTF